MLYFRVNTYIVINITNKITKINNTIIFFVNLCIFNWISSIYKDKVNINEMKWNEMKWNEMKWNEMIYNINNNIII